MAASIIREMHNIIVQAWNTKWVVMSSYGSGGGGWNPKYIIVLPVTRGK